MSMAQVYKVVASHKDEKTDETMKFSVIGRDLEDAKKKAKVKARTVLEKITSLVLSETEPDSDKTPKEDPKQTKIPGAE